MLLKLFQNAKGITWLELILVFLIVLTTLSSCLLSKQTGESSDISQPAPASPLPTETSGATRTVVNADSTSSAVAGTSTSGIVSDATATPENVNTIGEFKLIFYPPLVMNYEVQSWTDKSEYNNSSIKINYLQHQKLEACTIGVQGPSGFYPEDMKTVTLGKIVYQVFTQESSGKINTFYFAQNTTTSEGNIPILIVQSDASEDDECRAEAEKVLASLN